MTTALAVIYLICALFLLGAFVADDMRRVSGFLAAQVMLLCIFAVAYGVVAFTP